MNLPKGKLFALVALFAAIGLVTATGAFTTVTAERTATVDVAGDNAALLGLGPGTGSNADEYLEQTGDGNTLQINLAGQGSSGVNLDATTGVKDLFTISNQGSQPVMITITKVDDPGDDNGGTASEAHAVAFGLDATQSVNNNEVVCPDCQGSAYDHIGIANGYDARIDSNTEDPDFQSHGVVLEPGETIMVDVYIDTDDADFSTGVGEGDGISVGDLDGSSSGEDLIDNVVIHAEARGTDQAQYELQSS